MARKLVAVAFSLGCLHAGSLMALGLGEMELESFLNEPLKASVDLINMGGLHADEIKIRLGTSDDFDKLGLERAYFLTSIKFEVSDDGNGGARIVISTDEPVLEPYLDFIVEARWPSGRLLREYTVLVDPPVFSQSTQVVSASQRVEEVEGIAASAKKNERADASRTSADENDATIGAWGSQEGKSGGTRVDVRESNLPSGAMPQRSYNATSSPAPTPGSRYMISRDQTLWDIANRAKPAGVSVQQTMLEIQRLNPDAFINGNINRIKAGFIIYLPNADDISSADLPATLAEVREQNAAWREGRDAQLNASKRPSLRISAEPEEAVDAASANTTAPVTATADTPLAGTESPAVGNPSSEVVKAVSPESATGQDRLAAIEEQLATLQRIVSLKDDQIAALQTALVAAGGTTAVDPNLQSAIAVPSSEATVATAETPIVDTVSALPSAETPIAESVPLAEPEAVEAPAAAPAKNTSATAPDAATGGSWISFLPYILGALVLAVAGFVFTRRKGVEDDDIVSPRQTAYKEDVFSDVRLQDQNLALEPSAEEVDDSLPIASSRSNRGYGERKHDEYASDVDEADALAQADIYIAYGRHRQAIDLLDSALDTEPGNPVYRLKLLEIHTELNNHSAATAQLAKIRAIGDPDSIARAESMMERLHTDVAPEPTKASVRRAVGDGPGLAPNPLAMMTDSNDTLEADFSGLEIEGSGVPGDDDDLDLSGDFGNADTDRFEDEELVIAADSNGLSTKLDLARAYLDMGDDDGARQILEEVVAEGSEELKAEARVLLDRIGG